MELLRFTTAGSVDDGKALIEDYFIVKLFLKIKWTNFKRPQNKEVKKELI